MAKRKTNKSTRVEKITHEENVVDMPETSLTPARSSSNSSLRRYIIIIVLVILALLAFRFKNLFIVATVNGKPITRLAFEKELNSKFGDQTLENMISEQIILSEAKNKGVSVEKADVDSKVKEIEERLKGQIALDDALKAQGLTKESFEKQLEVQLIIDKMFDKEATISDKEIDEYLSQNQEALASSTDPAKLREDIYQTLKQQKVGDLFDKWFTEAKQKANIVKL